MLERGLEPLHFYKTLEPKPSVYTSFTTPTVTRLLLHFKGVEPLALSLENQYSAIELKMRGAELKGFEPSNVRIKNGRLNHFGYNSRNVLERKRI